MRLIRASLVSVVATLIAACTPAADRNTQIPDEFQVLIPSELPGGLRLVELADRCADCPPWRSIEYFGNESDQPIKSERVSVSLGFRAMYAYPNSDYFANTKIEKSAPGSYFSDSTIVVDALKHEYERKRERISRHLKDHPEIAAQLERHRAIGRDYLTLEEGTSNGYSYISYTENVIGLLGNTISQIHIFVPQREVIVTAYLLRQERSKFRDIQEFLVCRRDFLEGYTSFLAEQNSSDSL